MDWIELNRHLKKTGRAYNLIDDGEEFTVSLAGYGVHSSKTLQGIFDWVQKIPVLDFLTLAQEYSEEHTGCLKVAVGAVIVGRRNEILSYGTNLAVPDLCRNEGCLRILKFGNDYKTHRGATDCRAIHSEVQAICNCAKNGIPTEGATIYVTRYPCESCARQIVAAGISKVVYGRQQEISEMTKEIFDTYKVEYVWNNNFYAEDTIR